MKKTMKRYLSFLLAIMMLVTSVAFSTSAVATCNHETATGDPTYYEEVAPTCETMGYKIYYCTKCSRPDLGQMVEVSRGDYVKAYGHLWDDGAFESNDKGAYRKYSTCRRVKPDGEECGAKSVEMDGKNEVVYYLVNFYNNKVTASYDDTVTYTKVAKTYKAPVLLYSAYVKEGTEAIYEADAPTREKTKAFPRYSFVGWTENAYLREATSADNLSTEECADLSNITGNKDYYPVFVGETQGVNGVIKYDVVVYTVNEEGTVVPGTVNQEIPHGASPKYSYNGEYYPVPSMPEDIVNTYTFNGWSTKHNDVSAEPGIPLKSEEKDGKVIYGIEDFPVYGNVNFYPKFIANPKDYTVEFYRYDGKTPIKYTYALDADNNPLKAEAVFDGVHLKTNLYNVDGINLLNADKVAMDKPEDDTYIYIWTGQWAILAEGNTAGRTVDLKNFSVIESELLDVNGKKVIRLVPVYDRVKQLYAVDIVMSIPQGEDKDYYRGEAVVQVVANNGQLVASGKTDENGKFRCYLYNQKPFTVTIATQDEKYLGTAEINFLQKIDGSTDLEASVNKCTVAMEMNPDYETHCTCIHHNSLLQPLIVRIYNILYSFFNVKYVCCYDMYSTIGPLLAYTA